MIRVALVNHASGLTDAQADEIAWALQHQAVHHIGPGWQLAQTRVARREPLATDWQLVFLDNSDQAGALGYHDDSTPAGLPCMKVFVQTCRADGIPESSCASHELAEALVDPFLNAASFDGSHRFWATEIGDPVQRGIYNIGSVAVSNFALPGWFDSNATSGFDFRGEVGAAFQVAEGGYGQYVDLTNAEAGWQQVGAELGAGHTRPLRRR